MPKNRKSKSKGKGKVRRCSRCRIDAEAWEPLRGGLCPSCLTAFAKARRARTGAKVLDRATDGGTVEREGREFRVVQLPATRRQR